MADASKRPASVQQGPAFCCPATDQWLIHAAAGRVYLLEVMSESRFYFLLLPNAC